ncbi:dihydrofolate reductase family protein [Nonomuraea sp. CA-218870]|uniref:dihydrofolate reductase family protein n=1 Tax=Nonomuraea sp. CA-218870 TaxID=3239998 RepID=UPI003D9432C1
MRKIIAGLFITLDGVVEAPEKWHFPYLDQDVERSVLSLLRRTEVMLLGRRTYEEFAPHWPQQDPEDPLAALMNGRTKYVVSSTLADPAWQNTTVITLDQVAALKEEPGGDIGMSGSPSLVVTLLREGLLDELHLLMDPVVLGTGRRLFEEGAGHIPLTLTRSATSGTGVLDLTYTRA